jgi:hypothetical protein
MSIRYLLSIILLITLIQLITAAADFRCTNSLTYTTNELSIGTDITTLTDYIINIKPCGDNDNTFGFPILLTCDSTVSRTVICVDSDTNVISNDSKCINGDVLTKPTQTRIDPPCQFQCYLSTDQFTGVTLPFSPNFDITTLPSDEQLRIGHCDVIPPVLCGITDALTNSRDIICVNSDNIILPIESCGDISTQPPTQRTEPPCTYWCSASPITVTTKDQIPDDGAIEICTDTNFFPKAVCNPYQPPGTRYRACEYKGIIHNECPVDSIDPDNVPKAVQDPNPNPSQDCVFFYECANQIDQFVFCQTPNLVQELCLANPQLKTEKCVPDLTDPTTGLIHREHITQCVSGLDCSDPSNPEGVFDPSFCTDLYKYQTSSKECVSRDLPIPKYTCPCAPQRNYLCTQPNVTLEEINANPSQLVDCINDAIFPASDEVKSCSDVVVTHSRTVACVDLDGGVSLVPVDGENTTPCAQENKLTVPALKKEYPGDIDCHYIVKCGQFNQTYSDINLETIDCPRFNENIPSPCFSEPMSDIFSLFPRYPTTTQNEVNTNSKNTIGSFCNSQNARMIGKNGYQYRTQHCLAYVNEESSSGQTIKRQLDPNDVHINPVCEKAPNYSNTVLPTEESCCQCKIGYTAGFVSAPKNRNIDPIEGDHLDRPWNEYNNCRFCSAYATFVFPTPPKILTTLLLGTFEEYNTALDELIVEIGQDNVSLERIDDEVDFLSRKKSFFLDFAQRIRIHGLFNSNNVNPMFIEERFVSLIGSDNQVYNPRSVRNKDYTPVEGDLVIILTVSGVCSNGKSDSLARNYAPWKRIREDLALPKEPLPTNSTTDDRLHPFNPLMIVNDDGNNNGANPSQDNLLELIQNEMKNGLFNTINKSDPLYDLVMASDNNSRSSIRNYASSLRNDNQQQFQLNHPIQNSQQFATLGLSEEDIEILNSLVNSLSTRNNSMLYNSALFQAYQITNITTQAMYSPTCKDYYDCPPGKSPFPTTIDDNDLSQNTTHLVVVLSIISLLFCIAFIIVLSTCGSSKDRQYTPQMKALLDGKHRDDNNNNDDVSAHGNNVMVPALNKHLSSDGESVVKRGNKTYGDDGKRESTSDSSSAEERKNQVEMESI